MLTDRQIRAAKPRERAYKLFDGGSLFLFVTPAGGKHWRWRYSFGSREKLLSLGPYPDVGLAQARVARDDARAVLRGGRDPALERRLRHAAAMADAANTFEVVARQWHVRNAAGWTGRHAADVLVTLERDVFPALGELPVRDITPPVVLAMLRDIEARGALETARRVRQRVSAVFVHAIASGVAEQDPAAIVTRAMAPVVKGRQPAVLELDAARAMLIAAEAVAAHPVTKLANRLLALTAVRPGELRGARWDEFEELSGTNATWRVPAARMKMKREHLVPLTRQAVATVAAVRTLTGRMPLVFPNARWAHRPMSENAIGYLLNRAGYHHKHVPHGWRATFSTVMNERFRTDRDVIDLMLAHQPENATEAAYNRAAHMERRRFLAQAWADLLLDGMAEPEALLSGARR